VKRREKVTDVRSVDFDDYSKSYNDHLNSVLRLSGEKSDYFDLYKINCLKRWVCSLDQKSLILDFGCGIGKFAGLMAQAYPKLTVCGYDVSSNSIELAREKWGHLKNLVFKSRLPDTKIFDLVTVANVFHHIKQEDRRETLCRLKTILKPGGMIAIFEHNPLNPLTLHVIKTCPFDEDAELIHPNQFIKLAALCGLRVHLKRYIVFFPKFLRPLRKIEPIIGFLPLGAQYMVLFGHNG